jgi:thiamine biosynthesis lipoprotein
LLDGLTHGTSYHIIYGYVQKRDFYFEVDSIFSNFEEAFFKGNSSSLISIIQDNVVDYTLDMYFTTCFVAAKKIWKETDGLVDLTIYLLSSLWGFDPRKKGNVSLELIQKTLAYVVL